MTMRLALTVAALTVVVLLAAPAGLPPAGGAEPPPTPPFALYLPYVAVPPPTPTPTATITPAPTRTRSAACMGDEEISFVPNPGNTGAALAVSATSARASVYVVMQVVYGSTGMALAGPTVRSGGKGYIWTWTFIPYQPGTYDASFYINNSDFCAGGSVQVQGAAVATPTPPPSTATPTPAPTAPPSTVVWDWRLSFLKIGISGASVAPGQKYWRVTKGVFQNSVEGGGGHSIFVDMLDEAGNRMTQGEGTAVGIISWGQQDTLTWAIKPANEYPVNYPMYNGLGSYSIWLTFGGLPSERLYGMGLVAADGISAPLLAEPGKIHVNYLFTFQRTTRTALGTESVPGLLDCFPGGRWRPSLPNEETEPYVSGLATSPLRLQRQLITPGPACHWFGP
jgi:hypothetical protein